MMLQLPRVIWIACGGYALLAVFAAAHQQGLFADGAYVLVRVIEANGLVAFQPPRRIAHFLHQFPTVLALRAGVRDLDMLAFVYGLTLHLLPLLITVAAYLVLPVARRVYFVFPWLALFGGTLGASFASLAEAPVASAVFWLTLMMVMFGAATWGQRGLLAAIAMCSVLLHEVYAFLGLILSAAAFLRFRDENAKGGRRFFVILGGWFLVVSIIQIGHSVFTPNPDNRAGFVAGLMGLKWLIFGRAINMPVVIGAAAIVAGAVAWFAEHRPSVARYVPRQELLTGGMAVLAMATISLPALGAWYFSPYSQFSARNHPAFVSALLALFAVFAWRLPDGGNRERHLLAWVRPPVVAFLAIGALGWHVVVQTHWSGYVEQFRSVLESATGLLTWDQALARIPPEERRAFTVFSWGWTNPSMSILLSPGGRVQTIIASRPGLPWHPFDPAVPGALPHSALWDLSAYTRELGASMGEGPGSSDPLSAPR